MQLISCKISEYNDEDFWIMDSIEDEIRLPKRSLLGHYYAKKFIADTIPSRVKDIKFKYTEEGKPYYDDNHHFSISHSADNVFVAYSDKPVGVDSEIIRRINPRFIYKVLANDEININADFSIEFLKAWTLKEAYLKLKGKKICPFEDITKQKLAPNHTIITNVSNDYIMTAIFEK